MWVIRLLKWNGIIALGVGKRSCMKGCVLENEKELRKEGREASDSRFSRDGDVTVVRWLVNDIVNIALSFVSIGE